MRVEKRGRYLLLMSLCFLAGGIGVAARFRRPENRDLFLRATQLKTTSGFLPSPTGYFWIDDRRLLLFPNKSGIAQAVRYDVVTGSATLLDRFNKAYQPLRNGTAGRDSLSPDGRWMLMVDSHLECRALSLDGLSNVRFKLSPDELFRTWLPAGNGVATLQLQGKTRALRVLNFLDAAGSKTIRLPSGLEEYILLGITPDERLVMVQVAPGKANEMSLAQVSLSPSPRIIQQSKIGLPPAMKRWSYFILSPDSRRVAYWVDLEHEPRSRTWTEKRFAFLYPPPLPRHEEQLWVSNIDGTGQRMVGTVNADKTFVYEPYRWTPDGRKISFIAEGSLWTVPVDG